MTMYLQYLLFFVLSFFLVYFTGLFFTRISGLRSDKRYTSAFLALFTGLCFVVIGTAVFYTNGRTITLGLLVTGVVFMLWNYRKQLGGIHIIEKREGRAFPPSFFVSCFIVVLIYSYRFYLIYNPGGIPSLPNSDTLFYANVSNYLGVSGVENISLDYLNLLPKSNDPYHYFDIWFNTFIIHVFQLNALKSYILITITLFIVTCWFGFMAIAEYFNKINSLSQLLSLSFLFFSGVYLPFYKGVHVLENSNVFTVDLLSYPKLTVVCLFLQMVTLLLIRKKESEAIWMLISLPFVFISTAIPVFSVLGLIALKNYWSDRNFKKFIISTVSLAVMAIALFSFYTFGQENQVFKIRKIDGGFLSLLNAEYLKTCVNIIGLTCIQIFVIYLPVILVLIPVRRFIIPYFNPLKNNISAFLFLIFFISLGSWAALHYTVDMVQLFSNISIVMISILIFVLVVFLNERISKRQRQLIYAVLGAVFIFKLTLSIETATPSYPQSTAYINQTSEAIKNINPLGAFIFNDSSYTNIFSKNPIFNISGKHLAYANRNAFTFSLSVYNSPGKLLQTQMDTFLMSRSAFYNYVEKQKLNRQFKSLAKSRLEFIYTYRIQYLIVERGVNLDSNLVSIISSEIRDSLTGEHFYLLDYRKATVFSTL